MFYFLSLSSAAVLYCKYLIETTSRLSSGRPPGCPQDDLQGVLRTYVLCRQTPGCPQDNLRGVLRTTFGLSSGERPPGCPVEDKLSVFFRITVKLRLKKCHNMHHRHSDYPVLFYRLLSEGFTLSLIHYSLSHSFITHSLTHSILTLSLIRLS